MSRDFTDRCDDTFRIGRNRQWRRDVARLTRKKGAPRGPAPVPAAVLCMAMRLREQDALAGPSDVQAPATGVVVPEDGGEGQADVAGGDGEGEEVMPDLPRTPRLSFLRRGQPRNLGRLGR